MSEHPDPFATPLVFFRVGWMDRYRGIAAGDRIAGGGAYVSTHDFGHEAFNFDPFKEHLYGYVQPAGPTQGGRKPRINIERLGAKPTDDSLCGVLVVWVAKRPKKTGAFVVGWYKDAMIFREWQSPPQGAAREHEGENCGYYVNARLENARLLAPDERVLRVPQKRKGSFGQSNVWYADDRSQHGPFRVKVLDYIGRHYIPRKPSPAGSGTPKQIDVARREEIERVAVTRTATYFADLGYDVRSVERDNVGWDLDATLEERLLRLEVKGLSGPDVAVAVTPNEYDAMRSHRDSYRLCVVTSALATPSLEVFAYSEDSGRWETPAGRVLIIEESIAARCRA